MCIKVINQNIPAKSHYWKIFEKTEKGYRPVFKFAYSVDQRFYQSNEVYSPLNSFHPFSAFETRKEARKALFDIKNECDFDGLRWSSIYLNDWNCKLVIKKVRTTHATVWTGTAINSKRAVALHDMIIL